MKPAAPVKQLRRLTVGEIQELKQLGARTLTARLEADRAQAVAAETQRAADTLEAELDVLLTTLTHRPYEEG